jgi:hypothetical protein
MSQVLSTALMLATLPDSVVDSPSLGLTEDATTVSCHPHIRRCVIRFVWWCFKVRSLVYCPEYSFNIHEKSTLW